MSQMHQFNDPASGDFIDFKNHDGDLMLFTVHHETPEHMTVHGLNTAIVADIVVLDGDLAGTVYENSPIYPMALKPALRPSVGGKMVVGRIGKAAAKPGQSPAWIINKATDEEKQIAARYLDGQGSVGQRRAEREAQYDRPF